MPVAKIGTETFTTLEAAIAAAEDDDTIELLDSVAMDNALLVEGKTLTVDLKGFTITPSENFTDTYIVSIENAANVTLTNGTINLLGKNLQVKTGATVTVAANTTVTGTATYMTRAWDGTYNIYGTINHQGASGAAVQSIAGGGVINVYDGALITAGGEANPIRCNFNDGAATINIYGGTLETRGGYTAIYAYKKGNKSVINVYGGLLLAGGSGSEANSIFAITTNDTKNPDNNCEVTVTPLTDACTAKFNHANAYWGLALADYCAPGYAPVLGNDGYYTIQKVYDITITDPIEGGTLETSVTNGIAAGTTVTVTPTPAENYELESITTNGTAITGTTFVMPAENVTVAATFKSTAPDFPVNPDEDITDKGEENIATAKEVFGDGLADYITEVYGKDGTIPASKLNATTEELIKIAKEYSLPIMSDPEVVITKAAEGTAFEFQILDDNVPVAIQADKVRSMVEFTADLGTAFGAALEKDVTVDIKTGSEGKTATADFTKATTAGFMRVKLSVPTVAE